MTKLSSVVGSTLYELWLSIAQNEGLEVVGRPGCIDFSHAGPLFQLYDVVENRRRRQWVATRKEV